MWRRSGILLQASMRHPVVAGTLQTAYAEPAARDQVIQDDEACDAEEQAPVHASTKSQQEQTTSARSRILKVASEDYVRSFLVKQFMQCKFCRKLDLAATYRDRESDP